MHEDKSPLFGWTVSFLSVLLSQDYLCTKIHTQVHISTKILDTIVLLLLSNYVTNLVRCLAVILNHFVTD